jgi:hypothetical protein
MAEPYHYVRFRWWNRVDLEKIAEDLRAPFSVKKIDWPRDERELSLLKDDRMELEVKADTLTARLSSFRALLTQKVVAPFTENDVELRRKVIEIYPNDRPTPFPWQFIPEPKFEVAEET